MSALTLSSHRPRYLPFNLSFETASQYEANAWADKIERETSRYVADVFA